MRSKLFGKSKEIVGFNKNNSTNMLKNKPPSKGKTESTRI